MLGPPALVSVSSHLAAREIFLKLESERLSAEPGLLSETELTLTSCKRGLEASLVIGIVSQEAGDHLSSQALADKQHLDCAAAVTDSSSPLDAFLAPPYGIAMFLHWLNTLSASVTQAPGRPSSLSCCLPSLLSLQSQ